MSPEPAIYERLFSPFQLGRLRLRNRIAMLPMGNRLADDGSPTEDGILFASLRARGGVGLIITGGTVSHPSAVLTNRSSLYQAHNPVARPGFQRLSAAVHNEGARLVGQIVHTGVLGEFGWGPSDVSMRPGLVPHAMTEGEVEEVVESYGVAAKNLIEAGFDGIEIHGGHGYLIWQFLSPLFNTREDRYGGSDDARQRLLLDVIDAVRSAIGPEPTLGVRLSVTEELEGGVDLLAVKQVAVEVEATRKVDYLNLNIGSYWGKRYVKDMAYPPGGNAENVAAVKGVVDLPVIYAQRVTTPEVAEHILEAGQADVIGLGRALLADPDFAVKARSGRADAIVRCVGCLQDCRDPFTPVRCMNNARTGRERFWAEPEQQPAHRPRKVLVVGGGPAGLETARVAALRGHDVTLLERQAQLGGLVRLAAASPYRREMGEVIRFRAEALLELGVDVRLGHEADLGTIEREHPDEVILATGSLPRPSAIAATATIAVRSVDETIALALEVDGRRLDGVARAVVADEGSSGWVSGTSGWEAISVAEILADVGIAVTYLTADAVVGASVPAESLPALRDRFEAASIRALSHARVSGIDPELGVRVEYMGVSEFVAADLVVVQGGRRAAADLRPVLERAGISVRLVGDCHTPRLVTNAVYEGQLAARSI